MSNTRMSAGNYSETSAEPCGYHVGGTMSAEEVNQFATNLSVSKDSVFFNQYFTGDKTANSGSFLASVLLDGINPVGVGDLGVNQFKEVTIDGANAVAVLTAIGAFHVSDNFAAPTPLSADEKNFANTYIKDGKTDFTAGISDPVLKAAYLKGRESTSKKQSTSKKGGQRGGDGFWGSLRRYMGGTPAAGAADALGATSTYPNFGPEDFPVFSSDYGFDKDSTKKFITALKNAKVEPVAKNYALDLSTVRDLSGNELITKSVSDLITGTRWVRTGDTTYKMITKDPKTKKEVTQVITVDNPASLSDIIESCFGTYIKDDVCKDTLLTIILADDGSKITDSSGNEITIDDKVKEIMETPLGQFAWMGEEISKIYPVIALKVLHRFGFREHTVPDANSDRDIRKIEDASHWLQSDHLEKKFGKEAINTMLSQNMTLVYYLDLVSEFVNINRTILNPDYVGSDGEGDSFQSQYTKDLGIKQRRERKDGDVGRLRSYIQHSRQFTSFPFMTPGLQQTLSLGKPVLTPVRTGQGLGTMYGPGRLTPFSSRYVTPGLSSMYARSDGGQFGGGDGGSSYGVRQFDDGEQGSRFGAKFIKKVFDNSLSSLKAKHKTIANEKQIKETLDDIIKKEDEVFKSVALIEWYNNLMNVTNNQKTETVSASKMQALIDRHQKLVKGYHSQEDVMLKILENLYTLKGDSDYVPIDFSA